MTLLEHDAPADLVEAEAAPATDSLDGDGRFDEPSVGGGVEPAQSSGRALAVAFLTASGAALTVGGVFGSWPARGLAVASVAVGVGWAHVCATRTKGRVLWQLLIVPLIGVLAAASLAVGTGGGDPGSLIGDAIKSGRALAIPVPFDPGWRPVLIALFIALGFATAWVAVRLRRPQTAVVLPLPLLGLAMISQPPKDQVVAGFLGLVPLVAAATLLFGDQGTGAAAFGREFEVKRLLRSVALAVPLLAIVLVLSQSSFLFPSPVYDPNNRPQKPKSIPLSAARDRVLFQVDGPITGPWVLGVLDVYDGVDWRLSPFDAARLRRVPTGGVVDSSRTRDVTVSFTTRDLGNSSTFPTPATPAKGTFNTDQTVLFDPRIETFRVKSGRVPANVIYSVSLPAYPTPALLRSASPAVPRVMREYLDIPNPPRAVRALLAGASANRWDRLNLLRTKLNEVVIARGSGTPGPVPPKTVQRLLAGDHEGSPFEIVAAEAMLARWAGIPSRIGFGFDTGQKETIGGRQVTTIRPKNASQFLEVWFDGYGWIPLVSTPPKAKASLDSDPNRLLDPTVVPSDDVSVQIVIPFEPERLTFVYDQVRRALLIAVPVFLALLALYLAVPGVQKWRRTNLRRRWAAAKGPRWEIAAAYAELRDVATDLSVGDPIDSPLEYRSRVVPDWEHDELAWLVSRVMYGDLGPFVGPDDAFVAWELSASLQRRLARAQPRQTQVLAWMSRASILEPYSDEVPNVRPLALRLRRKRRGRSLFERLRFGGRRRRAAASPRLLGKTHAAAVSVSERGRG